MCRLTDDMASGTFDDPGPEVSWLWRVIAFTAAMVFVGWLLSLQGCATTKLAGNVSEDIQLVLDRVHLDAQEVINHPERWAPAVDSLCSDGMITADQCVRLKAILKARAILVGPQSRVHPFRWELRRCPV